MESLRVTGLMSGLDTNSIVDAYMTSAKAPIVKLNQEIDELNFEKTTYNNIISMITDVKNSMLSLKMESTFKSKVTASTKEDVATAVAGINTPTGSYTLTVDKVAEPAYASSIYTNKVLAQAGAGIKSFTPSFSPYDQLEGTHNVEIYQGSNYGYNDKWFAKDTFTGNGNETYMVNHADKADKTLVNGNGELTQDVKGDFTFVYTYNGEQKNFTINMDYAKGTSLNKIAADMELEINAKMDALHSNNSEQTMKVTLNLDDDGFNFSFYDVDTQNEIEVLGLVQSDTTKIVQDMKQTFTIQQTTGGATNDLAIDLDIKAGTDINDVATEIKNQLNTTHVINADVSVKYNEKTSSYEFTITDPANSSTFSTLSIPDTTVNLGLYATYKSQSTKEITNIMVSNSAEKLGAKLNSGANNGSFITGTFEFEDGTTEKLICTEGHPFYVNNVGWVKSCDLLENDTVLMYNNSANVIIKEVEELEEEETTYNFEVEDYHTYYVGKNSILVHNTCNMDPSDIRFTQDSISSTFQDGSAVDDMVNGLKNGTIDPKSVKPIRVFQQNGKIYSLDNRRLYAFKQAGMDNIRVKWVNPKNKTIAQKIAKHFTTKTDGLSIIMRG